MPKKSLLDEMIAQTKLSKKQTDKQQKIVEAAVKMFASNGYANTSTSEIAKVAGVSEGTIFRHYGTKDNLLLAVILPFIKESLPSMAENVFKEVFLEDESFESFLRALIINRWHFLSDNKELFKVIVKELLYNENLKNELLPFFTENILKRLNKVIDYYKSRGELMDLPSEKVLKMMLTVIFGYFVSEFVLFPVASDEIKDKDFDTIVRFIMDGIRKETVEG
ncbi:TetR/AcrR family transcriptional regulator [Niallia endozanthoxylica]|uniref:TetR/AcrR family transcriptional regulator n=1 Tax=Niallia endozanthoxylica TaxID=2036016 RepID=A0A5J5HPL5_9BACI|nr:TetR/AcrR family transcriptional regulator [Niallia endozanthoxylica]KAA9021788.1 TetR/AcrR family transcriptional regulator [Niallia endozanthoxylica]